MRVDFFGTDNGLDPMAIRGGVYEVDLVMAGKEPICLYIGESVWIASRCGTHLYSLYEDPAYFGLTKEDLENNDITIRFSVITDIKGKKSELGVGEYKEEELKAIRENEPITRLKTSDRQIYDTDMKVKLVQEKLKECGYKE